MTKTVCDICGKEMPTDKFLGNIRTLKFCISSYGKIWDICTECRESLNNWITIRKQGCDKKVEIKEYVEKRLENYNKLLKSGIIEIAESEE